jgi:hypothetical protein
MYFLFSKQQGIENICTTRMMVHIPSSSIPHDIILCVVSSAAPSSYSIIKRLAAIKTFTFNAGGATI